jgi:hypothetical protein
MVEALANKPDEWYEKPAGVRQIGENYYLPGTEYLRPVLAGKWPTCPFTSYNPYNLTYAQLLVDGVPCVLAPPPPPPPPSEEDKPKTDKKPEDQPPSFTRWPIVIPPRQPPPA